jgi:hypothetical protein
MSERRQYTPGPWFYHNRTIYAENDSKVVWRGATEGFVAREVDVQLIVAAPELLEALEAAHEELGFHYYDPELEKQITNALAKARGETER